MHDRPSSEVEGAETAKPSPLTPDPMRQRIVHQCGPQQGEDDKGRELHPFGESPRNQGRSNDRKHQLKQHVGLMGNRVAVWAWIKPNASQAKPFEPTNEASDIWAKGEAIAPEHPLD